MGEITLGGPNHGKVSLCWFSGFQWLLRDGDNWHGQAGAVRHHWTCYISTSEQVTHFWVSCRAPPSLIPPWLRSLLSPSTLLLSVHQHRQALGVACFSCSSFGIFYFFDLSRLLQELRLDVDLLHCLYWPQEYTQSPFIFGFNSCFSICNYIALAVVQQQIYIIALILEKFYSHSIISIITHSLGRVWCNIHNQRVIMVLIKKMCHLAN